MRRAMLGSAAALLSTLGLAASADAALPGNPMAAGSPPPGNAEH